MTENEIVNALWKFTGQALIGIGAFGFVSWLLQTLLLPKDDTDPEIGRSNLRVLTDHRTGCQYLQAQGGGLTPRLDADGHHICQEPEQ